ncbi:MAG: aspartate--ammonia ligase [Clostridia bacterium]|nr:aspartate--ammonia ligase [Clostridia bacterium]
MNKILIPKGYKATLDRYDTQLAIDFIKQSFQKEFSSSLSLKRVSAPLFVSVDSGLNDNLNGYERPVGFDIPATGTNAEVVHSLAKWKRLALREYGFSMHEGILTDMNAIRRDEELDNLHSIYVDQWDWERIISGQDCNKEYLIATVQTIVNAICNISEKVKDKFSTVKCNLSRKLKVIESQELEDLYPNLKPEEREYEIVKKYKTVFIMKIGGKLHSGIPHGMRAPDYDNWELNGDIIFWDDILEMPLEVSSMGIRVDPETLDKQLTLSGCDERRSLPFHKMLLAGELPQTIGGGIGQSRLCMLLLQRAHIGEVQASIWDEETLKQCKLANVPLL